MGLLDGADKSEPKSGILSTLAQTWPARAVQGILSAVTLPGDVYAGRITSDDPAYYDRAIGLAGMAMGGGLPFAERGALGMSGGKLRSLPSSNSLATPPAPAAADMVRASMIENVPLSQIRSTQPKMQWERFNAGDHPPPMIKEFSDIPVAVRKEDGEYLIFDGHHRAVNAMNGGEKEMRMHVINAKDYAPEFAGRKPAPPSISDDDLLKMLLGE